MGGIYNRCPPSASIMTYFTIIITKNNQEFDYYVNPTPDHLQVIKPWNEISQGVWSCTDVFISPKDADQFAEDKISIIKLTGVKIIASTIVNSPSNLTDDVLQLVQQGLKKSLRLITYIDGDIAFEHDPKDISPEMIGKLQHRIMKDASNMVVDIASIHIKLQHNE